MEQYKAKGAILFRLGIDGIEYQIFDRDWYMEDNGRYFSDPDNCKQIVDMIYEDKFTKNIYDLFDGEKFLENVEDGCIIGDIGSSVAAYASQMGYCIKVKSLGIPDKFITHGTTAQQYGICSMTVDDIVNTVISSN